jgi:hypothetical protein
MLLLLLIRARISHFAAAIVLVLFSAANLPAQIKATHPNRVGGQSGDSTISGRESTREGLRFLGWKFAQRSGQDVSRWRRQGPAPKTGLAVRPSPNKRLTPLASSTGTSSGTAGFTSRPNLPAGYIPTAIVEGDFNGDGLMDVAISNGGDNTVYVLLGKGDGTFQVPEVLYTQGLAPVWIAAVSLRNNGHLDLAMADADSNSVEIFLGKGDGTFQPGVRQSLAQTPTFVLAGDFNKDGKPDLVVGLVVDAGKTEPQFEILLGDGSGGFAGSLTPPPITAIDSAIPTGWIDSGDINNDGYVDLVTTVTGGFALTYLNQAGKSFGKSASFGPNDGPMVVGLGDMDEDGCLDAVELGVSGYLTIAKGTCDGNFTQGKPIADVGDLEPAVKVVDVDGDGHLDVVGSAAYYQLGGPGVGAEGGYLVSVLRGDGKGNVNPAQIYRGGADSFSLVVADFTGDHRPEIVTTNSSENRATLFLNDGNGHFGAPQGEAIGYLTGVINSPNPNAPMEAVDLNGDGKPDLILVEDGVDISQPSQLTVMLNDGTGKFLSPVRSPILGGPNILEFPRFVTGAFRNSTYPDLILISGFTASNPVLFLPGNRDGTFGSPTKLATLPNPLAVVSGDFNNDGKLDFAVYSTNVDYTQVQVDVFQGQGDGTFHELPEQTFASPSTGSPLQIFALDLNHDGKTDLLIGNNLNGGWTDSGDDLVEFLGNGDGTFQAPKILIPHFGAVALADLNGDGLPDLIQGRDPTENVGQTLFGTPAVTVYLNKGNGTFAQQPTYTLPGSMAPTTNPVLVGDFNGDGIPDIGYRHQRDDLSGDGNVRIRVLQGVRDGTFVLTGHIYDLPALSYPFVGVDFDGDGKTDLVELTGYETSFHTIPAAPNPSLGIAFNSSPLVGTTGSATVTLDIPAGSSQLVNLSASDSAVQLPANLNFAPGQQEQSFSFALGPNLDSTHVLALYASLGSETAVAFASKPNPNVSAGVEASLLSGVYPLLGGYGVTPGESFRLTLLLLSQSGYSGTFSSFECGGLPPGASCIFDSNSVIVYPGWFSQATFTVNTSSSTPYGMYPAQVTSTDGYFPAAVTLPLGIGNFSLSLNPSTIVLGPNGSGLIAVGSTSTNGLSESVTISCSGLPAGAGCGGSGSIPNANGGGSGVTISSNGLAIGDYPFQVRGTANIASQSANALLRVGDFTAALDKTAATLSPGQSAMFTVTLTSLNHYTSSISMFCQSPSNSVTCTVSPLPASLTDNGTAIVQLTVSASASAAAIFPRGFKTRRFDGRNLSLLLLLTSFIVFLCKLRKFVPVLAMAVFLLGIAGCGSSGGSTGSTQPVSPSPPQPQTVKLLVVASAAFTTSDADNQETLGPIVITID